MDVKKTDSPIISTPPKSVTKQTGESHNQSSQQPKHLDLNTNVSQQLKIGQQLKLLVIKISTSDALLEIIGTNTQVRTTDKALLELGQTLKAQITQTQPTVELKVLSTNSAANEKVISLINSALRQLMPQQQPLKNLLDNIQQLPKENISPNHSLHKIKDTFIQSIPPSQAFEDAKILPKILNRSGMFTEHLLANIVINSTGKTPFPRNDLKISLLRLATQLRSLQSESTSATTISKDTTLMKLQNVDTYTPAIIQKNQQSLNSGAQQAHANQNTHTAKNNFQHLTQEQLIDKLLNLTEGSIAKIQTQQLQQYQLSDVQKPAWSFELPIRSESGLDNVTIYINKDDSNNETNQYTTPWKLVINLNIEGLGTIQANVTLQGTKISVTFWVENSSTSLLFYEHLHLLESKLNNAGLEPARIHCHCDKAPQVTTPIKTSTLNEEI